MDHHTGENLSFLSLNILYRRKEGVLTLDQNAYVEKFLDSIADEFEVKEHQYPSIALDTLGQFENSSDSPLDNRGAKAFRRLLMTLMYVALRTRPDICYEMNVLSRFMAKPTQNAWNALVKVIGYIKQNPSLWITYKSDREW
jgi:hypothetical protein